MIFEKKIIEAFRSQVCVRADETGDVFYFSAKDFEGLVQEAYSFRSKTGDRLQGYFYYYGTPDKSRIVVFDHGMGGGHRSYMQEIVCLAKHGYCVFSYDHTGCMESEGVAVTGFAGSLSDLDDCLCALKADENYQNARFSVVGHSWGAFSTMNIVAYHPDVTHVVAMSGFVSVKQIIKQSFRGLLACYRRALCNMEYENNAEYSHADARQSLQNTNAKVLLIHSNDDPVVHTAYHFALLKQALGDHDNISFLLVDKKGHNPNYTEDAVKYKNAFFAELTQKRKNGALADEATRAEFVKQFDWTRMTAQDPTVWERIFQCLDA